MQQIERYGVIALVFLLVTIVAISFWGDSKSPGFWSRLVGKGQPKKELVVTPDAPKPADALPLSATNAPVSTEAALSQPASSGGEIVVAPTAIPTLAANTVVPPASTPAPNASQGASPAMPASFGGAPVGPSEHVVQKGDSLAKIAASRLGDERRWTEIEALNPGVTPKSLAVGQKLKLPTGAARGTSAAASPTKAAKPDAVAKSTAKKTSAASRAYIVKKGDSLRSIAADTLGDASRWKEIADANPRVDARKLAVGEKLAIPSGDRGALVASAAPAVAAKSDKPRVR